MASEHYQRVEVTSRKALRQWLEAHHTQKQPVWLVTYKKADKRYLPYEEMVQEALCFGWIDSLPRKLDELRSMRLLSPRKPNSAWSKVNKSHVEQLTAAGLMTDAGLRAVELAKSSGAWSKLDAVETLAEPDDLAAALIFDATAQANFNAFPPSARKAILDWISQARRPETRASRITETVEKAKLNQRANQWRQPSGK